MILPNLFIVGAPKCGTTALDYYLSQHPDIYMSPAKQLGIENNHFATDLLPLDDPYRTDEKYHALFEKAGNEKILGESSVYHLFSREAAINIFRFNPDAKIIIMLQNPVEMLESYHAQLICNGDEDIMNFDKALQAEEKRKSGRLKIRPGGALTKDFSTGRLQPSRNSFAGICRFFRPVRFLRLSMTISSKIRHSY